MSYPLRATGLSVCWGHESEDKSPADLCEVCRK